jgi:hypothetical protein
MQPAVFESEIPVSERTQTYDLDRAATGIGRWSEKVLQNVKKFVPEYECHGTCTWCHFPGHRSTRPRGREHDVLRTRSFHGDRT